MECENENDANCEHASGKHKTKDSELCKVFCCAIYMYIWMRSVYMSYCLVW